MESIRFHVNDPELRVDFLTRALPEAIQSLSDDTVPQWGAMTAQHMVEHLLWSFHLSTGQATVTCATPEDQHHRMKAWLYDDRPSPRAFRNPRLPEAPGALTYGTMDEARPALLSAIDAFLHERNTNAGALKTHPLFGALRADEWERVHFKHSYHHLLQFGLIRDPE